MRRPSVRLADKVDTPVECAASCRPRAGSGPNADADYPRELQGHSSSRSSPVGERDSAGERWDSPEGWGPHTCRDAREPKRVLLLPAGRPDVYRAQRAAAARAAASWFGEHWGVCVMTVHEVRLARIPEHAVRAADFEVVEAGAAPELLDGHVSVGLRRLGLNAGLANRIGGSDTAYGPGIGVGDVPASDAVVEVLASASDEYRVGDLAVRTSPWRDVDVAVPEELRRIPAPYEQIPLEAYLTVLGHVGFTAYTGLVHVGEVRRDDVVFVSGAAGGVGSCAVQFAKARGARVIGSAGSAEKVKLLTEALGADAAFNYHDGDADELLRAAAPEGIDLYFDTVGGDQLDAALGALRYRGRVVICGASSQYGSHAERRGPANYTRMIYQELTMRGFTVTAHEDLRPVFAAEVGALVHAGTVSSLHTVLEGFGRIPEAFAALLAGGHSGRVIVST